MPTPRIVAALAAALVSLAAPAASADEPAFDCAFRVSQLDVSSQPDMFAVGFVAHGDASAVSITCSIRVDGVTVQETPTGTGVGAAVTGGRLGWWWFGGTVEGCATATVAGHPAATRCRPFASMQVPPQEVIDVLNDAVDVVNDVFVDHVDPVLCDVLADVDEPPGPVVVTEQGDVYVLGEPMWDCPPYDIWPVT